MNLDQFLMHINATSRKPTSDGGCLVSCPCPDHGQGHGDRHQSLSINAGATGGVVLYCHAGCRTEDVVAAFGLTMADLMDGKEKRQAQTTMTQSRTSTEPRRKIAATYTYVDEAGNLLFQVIRFEPKDFRQRRPDGDGDWVWKLGSTRRVLYRLPQIIAAVSAGQTIYIVEGEKDVQAIEEAGGIATCNPGGAGKWRDEYSEFLRGAEVVIVADRDEPGRAHAAAVAASVAPLAAAVRVVEAAEGKDAFDHLAAGKTVEEFVTIDGDAALASLPTGTPATLQPELEPLVLEAAHASVLANEWRDQYRWAGHEGAWRLWTGRVWKKVSEPVVVNAAQKVLRRYYGQRLAAGQSAAEDKRLHDLHRATCRYASVLGGLAFLKGEPGFHTEFEEWDADAYTENCADGLLDMRTQTLRPHDQAALCTKITRWSFADTESTGAWERHLRRCLPDDDVRRQVQRDLGRALVGTDLEESLPIWYGSGANGKSTTARTILQGVGEYGRQAVKDLLVAAKFERHSTDLADLAGSRIVIAEEIQDGKHLDEAAVKNLTGGNRKKARFMRCDNFEFEQTFSIFLLVNHRPVITGTDKGIWRRLRVVPWTVSIPFAEQRPQDEMVAELMADGAWMMRWMAAGFADWQADHYWIAEPVKVATAAYEAEQDVLAGFLNRRCVLNPQATVTVDQLHEAYIIDTLENGDEGVEPLTKIAFGKRLKGRNFTQDKATGGSRVWHGIGLVATSGKKSG
jgi:putative DNA primase/helicase